LFKNNFTVFKKSAKTGRKSHFVRQSGEVIFEQSLKDVGMLNKLRTWLRALLCKSEVEREFDEELRNHIERQTEQNVRLGMNPQAAWQAALKSFGGVEQAKERSRDAPRRLDRPSGGEPHPGTETFCQQFKARSTCGSGGADL
jgi:hypothetical protein